MHASQVIRILNGILKRIDPAIKLSTDTDEALIERNLNSMLVMYDQLASLKGGGEAPDARYSLRLAASKKRGPATDSRVKSFVSSLTSAGVPLQKAFNQAVRLGVGGAVNE